MPVRPRLTAGFPARLTTRCTRPACSRCSHPGRYGGLEVHPVEAMRVWEAVARVDSAAAWNLVMNQASRPTRPGCRPRARASCSGMGRRPRRAPSIRQRRRPGSRAAGGSPARCPSAVAATMPDGWRCRRSSTRMADRRSIRRPAGPSRSPCSFRGSRRHPGYLAHVGMRGTGSTDYAVQDLFVPDHLTAPVGPLAGRRPDSRGRCSGCGRGPHHGRDHGLGGRRRGGRR